MWIQSLPSMQEICLSAEVANVAKLVESALICAEVVNVAKVVEGALNMYVQDSLRSSEWQDHLRPCCSRRKGTVVMAAVSHWCCTIPE